MARCARAIRRYSRRATHCNTRGLSDQQLALKARLLEAQRQAQQYTDVVRDMRGEAQALSPALEAAFRQLGMRGVQQITAEIERLQAAMHSL